MIARDGRNSYHASSARLASIEQDLFGRQRCDVGFELKLVLVFFRLAEAVSLAYRLIRYPVGEILNGRICQFARQPIKIRVIPAIHDNDASSFSGPPARSGSLFHKADASGTRTAPFGFLNSETLSQPLFRVQKD